MQIGNATWRDIATGDHSTIAIRTDGTLWGWGENGTGQTGNGTTINSNFPVQAGSDTDWKNVSAGAAHSMGLKNNGTIWAWGTNWVGQYGNGTATTSYIPQQVGTDTDWVSIASGENSNYALKANGSFWGSGWNFAGQLGNGSISNVITFIEISGECPPCTTTAQFTLPTTNLCKNSPLTFPNTSTNATTYQWLVNNTLVATSTDLTHTFTTGGTYTVKLIASNGNCSDEYTQSITIDGNCVWPGDANSDGTVNMLDWLAVGLAYNATGTARSDQSITYNAKAATDFATSYTGSLFAGINHKHADCNGNGTVNIADTLAIVQNFGMVHALGAMSLDLSNSPEALLSTEANTPVVTANTDAAIDVTLKNALNGGAVNCYGMAFTVHFRGTNPRLDFTGSCFGTLGTDFIAAYKVDEANEHIYIGITRFNHTNISAIGKVATIVVTIDELPASDPLTLNMPIIEAVIGDNNGNEIPVGVGSTASIEVYDFVTQSPPALLKAKLWLQGAARDDIFIDEPQMSTALRNSNLLPTQQPYNTAPWHYFGNESPSTAADMPLNAVDWVLLELRDAVDSTQVVWQKAVLLLADGSLQDARNPYPQRVRLDMPNSIDIVPTNGSYYLVARHRNHIAVVSSTPLAISNNLMTCDFTQSASQVMGSNQLVETHSGYYALRAGDLNGDGIINVLDYNTFAASPNIINQYHRNDCNLDRMVTVADFNAYMGNLSVIGVPLVRY